MRRVFIVNLVQFHQAGMTKSACRLLYFVFGFLLALGLLELLVRQNAHLFEAASHRALAKAAMFEKHPRVNILFLGTSRTQDGVSPDLVTRALGEIAPKLGEVRGFNAAFTGSSLDSLIAIAPRFGFRPDLRVVVIELSAPQIGNDPTPWEEPKIAPQTIEDKLAAALRSIYFVRYRTAFNSDNLGRLPALLIFGSSMGGWETKGNDQLAAWLGRKEQAAVDFNPALWTPELFTPDAPPTALDSDTDAIATKLVTLIRQFENHGIKVVFTVPPLTRAWFESSPEKDRLRLLFSEIARRGKCEVWNFSTLRLPDSFFRDPSHLGKEGRAHYSRALALQMARVLNGE
jgi:hypothetical protein